MPFTLNISGNISFSEAVVYLVCSGRKQTKYGHISCETEVPLMSENFINLWLDEILTVPYSLYRLDLYIGIYRHLFEV